ncbi:MAG: alpha/beta hydrolase [Alphaproteobacteria bacterium]|nr:alpha/beta hydrolase [Alphaproteobacteria bacterium]
MDRTTRYRQAEERLFADAGISPVERTVRLARIGTSARILEVGEGPPALFLTGGPNAAATWAYVVAACRGMRCLLLDRPGTGLSEPPPRIPDNRALPDYLATLSVDVLDALELGRASLVGSSLGGFSALRTAIAHPDRVDRLVLLGCPAFVPGWSAPSFFTVLRTPLLGSLVVAAPVTPSAVRFGLRQMGHARSLAASRFPAAMLDWSLAWQRDTDTMRHDAAMIAACGTWLGGFDPALDLDDDAIARVEAPVLVLGGGDDPVGGEDVVRSLAGRLPRAEVDVLDGGGHLPWLDDPAWAAAGITSWVVGPGAGRTSAA